MLQVEQLQQQIELLAESQLTAEEEYQRARQDNAGLNCRLEALEEHTKDLEWRGEEKIRTEQSNYKVEARGRWTGTRHHYPCY